MSPNSLSDLITRDDLHYFGVNLENRIVNRVLLVMIALTGINITAVALLTQL